MDRDEFRLAQLRLALEVLRTEDLVRDSLSSSLVNFVWLFSMALLFAIWIPGVPWWVVLAVLPLVGIVWVDGFFQERRWKRRQQRADRLFKAAEDPHGDIMGALRKRDGPPRGPKPS